METKTLEAYRNLLDALEEEKASIEKRIGEIRAIISDIFPLDDRKTKPAKAQKTTTGARRGRRAGGGFNLRAELVKALSEKPMKTEEAFNTMKERGWKTDSENPIMTVRSYLYNKKHFKKNDDGTFSPAVKAAPEAPAAPQSEEKPQVLAGAPETQAEAQGPRKRGRKAKK